MKEKISNQKGASMLLVICLFLVLTVLGINLMNAANANVSNTMLEYEKEQTMLYVSSIYELVNEQIEEGLFFDEQQKLPEEVTVLPGEGFKDQNGNEIGVKILFRTESLPIETDIVVTYKNAQGDPKEYIIRSTYSRVDGQARLERESCKGLLGDENNQIP